MSIKTSGDPEVLEIAMGAVQAVTGRYPEPYMRGGKTIGSTRGPIPVLIRWCVFELLRNSGWTQQKIGEKVGVSRDTVQYGLAQIKQLRTMGSSLELLAINECSKKFDLMMKDRYFQEPTPVEQDANTLFGEEPTNPQ